MAFTLDSLAQLGPVLGSTIIWFVIVGIGLAFIGLLAYWGYNERQYRYKAVIMRVDDSEDRSNVRKTFIVRMRKNIKKGWVKMKQHKLELSIPPSEYWIPIGKGEGVYYQWDGRELFTPVKPTVNSPVSFTPADYDIMDEMVRRKSNAVARHGTATHWQKYGTYYVIFGVTLIMVIGMYMMGNDIGEGLKSVGGGLNNLAHNSNLGSSGVEVLN